MASAMRRMAEYLGLVDDEGRYEEEAEVVEDDHADTRPVRRQHADDADVRPEPPAGVAAFPERRGGATVAAVRPVSAQPVASPVSVQPVRESAELSRITTLHPRTYNDARIVGEHFRDGTPVIMNLTSMDDQDAKRLVDFAAGLIFGLRGTIEKITTKVFLLSPVDVEVTAEDKRRIVETDFFNQS